MIWHGVHWDNRIKWFQALPENNRGRRFSALRHIRSSYAIARLTALRNKRRWRIDESIDGATSALQVNFVKSRLDIGGA
jgi:hypothetical protein